MALRVVSIRISQRTDHTLLDTAGNLTRIILSFFPFSLLFHSRFVTTTSYQLLYGGFRN